MNQIKVYTTTPIKGAHDFRNHAGQFSFHHFDPARMGDRPDGRVFVFIDWTLPEISGLQLCRQLRAQQPSVATHVTMVLSESDDEARRRSLSAGADDYMVGPLDLGRVMERLLSIQTTDPTQVPRQATRCGDLVVDTTAVQARWRGCNLRLAEGQFRLLQFLAEHPRRALSRAEIIEGVGKQSEHIQERSVDVWIKRLRRAFQDAGQSDVLRTVNSKGYVLYCAPGTEGCHATVLSV